MALYMLDTDTVSFALRAEGRVAARILAHRPDELCLSSITLGELRYGAELRQSRKLDRLVRTFTQTIEVLPFDARAAQRFGSLAALLKRGGSPIGQFDTLIAAHAMSLGLTLVTHNSRHFERVPGLKTDDWV